MKRLTFVVSLLAAAVTYASEQTPVTILGAKHRATAMPGAAVIESLRKAFASDQYREIKAQPIVDRAGKPHHLLVHLLSKGSHRLELARVLIDRKYRFLSILRNYAPTADDTIQQPGPTVTDARCPDDTTEIIAIVPNNDPLEQATTREVADAARAHGFKTVELVDHAATRAAWLNYMMCPKLRANFYDGDSDRNSIETVDGLITAQEIAAILKHQWNYNVTNVWVACQAYNNPMLNAVIKDAQAKKYAAGINDLLVGPSDRAAACAMKAFMDGSPMTAAFDDCYRRLDDKKDHWGFGSGGVDTF